MMKRFNTFLKICSQKQDKIPLKIVHRGISIHRIFPPVDHLLKIYYKRLPV
jgi:hypothetical protein